MEELNRFLEAYNKGLTAGKAAKYAYGGKKPFGRCWDYFGERILKQLVAEGVTVEQKNAPMLIDAENPIALTFQQSMFCLLIRMDYAKGEAAKLCKFRLPRNFGLSYSRYAETMLRKDEISDRIEYLNMLSILTDTPKYEPIKLNDVRAIENRLSIKKSVFCALIAKGVYYLDAAKLVGFGRLDGSRQSLCSRMLKETHVQMYIGHLIHEQNELQSLL